MEKSVKISLSGNLFQADQDAYYLLRDYLGKIEKRLGNTAGAKETMDDIELRIAEIFRASAGSAGVISRADVEEMMKIIGAPSDFEQEETVSGNAPGPEAIISKARGKAGTGKIFGDIFGAVGKVFYVIFRIAAIFIGLVLLLIGFISLMVTVLIFFIRNTGFLPFKVHGNLFYLPDFIRLVVNPPADVWICILTCIVILLPLLAMIYWGIRLIFWFRSRDGVFSLVAFVVWVVSLSALAIIISGQGLAFSETGRSVSAVYLKKPPKTLHIVAAKKISNLDYDCDMILPDDAYSMFANSARHEISVKTRLRIRMSEDSTARIETVKTSAASGRSEASRKAEQLPACSRFSHDTLYVDEFFTLASDRKWSGDLVSTDVYLPSNSLVSFDQDARDLFCLHCSIDNYDSIPDSSGRTLKVTPDGLKSTASNIP